MEEGLDRALAMGAGLLWLEQEPEDDRAFVHIRGQTVLPALAQEALLGRLHKKADFIMITILNHTADEVNAWQRMAQIHNTIYIMPYCNIAYDDPRLKGVRYSLHVDTGELNCARSPLDMRDWICEMEEIIERVRMLARKPKRPE